MIKTNTYIITFDKLALPCYNCSCDHSQYIKTVVNVYQSKQNKEY